MDPKSLYGEYVCACTEPECSDPSAIPSIYDSSMLHGTGRNNPEYIFFVSYQYTKAPNGIVNGITGGGTDEHDIDYMFLYENQGKGH